MRTWHSHCSVLFCSMPPVGENRTSTSKASERSELWEGIDEYAVKWEKRMADADKRAKEPALKPVADRTERRAYSLSAHQRASTTSNRSSGLPELLSQ